ncbi:hypothetical protein N7457_005460 [Penicillium paradoxum]|uniref:uncharacterized protein n=1 Tax=Penicillium paradoxum TaxID=176176 RepID=UPI0025476E2B|nr:uncharacterized protein N7457_005460 [Penicillium paradoxum]KAJ5780300.1 hypothetical protein N7457_005460 [Penicillium paradoxum]
MTIPPPNEETAPVSSGPGESKKPRRHQCKSKGVIERRRQRDAGLPVDPLPPRPQRQKTPSRGRKRMMRRAAAGAARADAARAAAAAAAAAAATVAANPSTSLETSCAEAKVESENFLSREVEDAKEDTQVTRKQMSEAVKPHQEIAGLAFRPKDR